MSIVQEKECTLSSPVVAAIEQLQRLSDLFVQRREQLARAVNLTVQQWCVLDEVTDEQFMPSMFARRRDSSAAAVSKIIRQLIDKKLIEVAVDGNDGRMRRYTLTVEGEALMERLRRERQEAIDAIWSQLPLNKLVEFQHFAADLSDRLEKYSEDKANNRKALEG